MSSVAPLALTAIACFLVAPSAAAQTPPSENEDGLLAWIAMPWTGDLDGMIERRSVRALVAPARMEYWIDRGRENGAEYELLTKFEEELNRRYKTQGKHPRIRVYFIPTARDRLLPALLEGRGAIAAGIPPIPPERQPDADFGAAAEAAGRGPADEAVGRQDTVSERPSGVATARGKVL